MSDRGPELETLEGAVPEFAGRVILNDACSYPCTIHNTSPAGARIRLEAAHYIPPRFDLELAGATAPITCRRAWQSGTEIGAHFVSALVIQLPLPPAPPEPELNTG